MFKHRSQSVINTLPSQMQPRKLVAQPNKRLSVVLAGKMSQQLQNTLEVRPMSATTLESSNFQVKQSRNTGIQGRHFSFQNPMATTKFISGNGFTISRPSEANLLNPSRITNTIQDSITDQNSVKKEIKSIQLKKQFETSTPTSARRRPMSAANLASAQSITLNSNKTITHEGEFIVSAPSSSTQQLTMVGTKLPVSQSRPQSSRQPRIKNLHPIQTGHVEIVDDQSYYITPSYSWVKNHLAPTDKSKRFNYLTLFTETKDQVTRVYPVKKSITPAASKYSKITKWTDTSKNRCKIDKAARNTYVEQIFKKESERPGPHTYDTYNQQPTKTKMHFKFTNRTMMEQAPFNEWKSAQTPFAQKYQTDIAFAKQVKVRNPIHDFARNIKKEEYPRYGKDEPAEDKNPGVNQYKVELAKEKSIDVKNPRQPFNKQKRETSFEEHVRRKSYVPGVGKYLANMEKPWAVESKHPSQVRVRL